MKPVTRMLALDLNLKASVVNGEAGACWHIHCSAEEWSGIRGKRSRETQARLNLESFLVRTYAADVVERGAQRTVCVPQS